MSSYRWLEDDNFNGDNDDGEEGDGHHGHKHPHVVQENLVRWKSRGAIYKDSKAKREREKN